MASHIAAGVVLALAFFAAGIDSYAATLVVTKTADTADGICDADCSLREAVIAAASGDPILFSSLFNSPQTITLTNGQMLIAKDLTITGTGSNLVTVSGNQAGRIFEISQGAVVTLSGMTLRDGRVDIGNEPSGGAIDATDSDLTLLNMSILSNRAYRFEIQPFYMEFGRGGGIYAVNSNLSLVGTYVRENYSFNSGGIYMTGSSLTVDTSIVDHNRGGGIFGGSMTTTVIRDSTIGWNNGVATPPGSTGRYGLLVHGDSVQVLNSTIAENWGTGISAGGGNLVVDRSVVRNNVGGQGGIRSFGSATIYRSTIDGNEIGFKGGDRGGGIWSQGRMSISDSTISNNRAAVLGGGIYTAFFPLNITNSTISGNTVGGCSSCTGAGIHAALASTVLLTNSTVTKNRIGIGRGGGIASDPSAVTTVELRNTIVAENISERSPDADISGAVISHGHNLIGNTTGSSGWLATDLLNRNAALAPLANNGGPTWTHALLPNSQAVNSGNDVLAVDPDTGLTLTGDQRGSPRFVGTVDIGAFESNFTVTYVMFAGRVTTSSGRGVSKAVVTLSNGQETIYAHTNPFGYYRFVNLLSGSSYLIGVSDKRYEFGPPQPITLTTNPPDINFVAQ